MKAFYRKIRWLELKAKILDEPAYSRIIHRELSGRAFKRVLECGTGTGKFIGKLEEFVTFDSLVAFDIDPDLVAEARKVFGSSKDMTFHVQDLYHLDPDIISGGFDLIAGQAFLEHTDPHEAVTILKRMLNPGGFMYFAHNYMSPTLFEPCFDKRLDEKIVENFDEYSIENQDFNGKICGDSKCGRRIFHVLHDAGLEIMHFASTDWLLSPLKRYTEDEKEILRIIIDFFYEANRGPSVPRPKRVDPKTLDAWKADRYDQIERNRLIFICPQTSILARAPRRHDEKV